MTSGLNQFVEEMHRWTERQKQSLHYAFPSSTERI